MDQYQQLAKLWIERFYHCNTEEEQTLILEEIADADLEVLKYIVLDSCLYSDLYNKDNPELLPPPAGYKGR